MPTTKELFCDCKLRCTRQRAALYEALVEHHDHPTAEQLYRRVRRRTARLSRATVYNTLEALCRAGLARKLQTNNSCCRYDADTTEHLHLCFRETGEIADLPDGLGRKLLDRVRRSVIAEIERELDVEVDDLSIQLLARRS